MIQYFYRDASVTYHITQAGDAPHSEYLVIRNTPDPWMP
jgi:hypothetical protein